MRRSKLILLAAVLTACFNPPTEPMDVTDNDAATDPEVMMGDRIYWPDPNTLPDGTPSPCLGQTECRACNAIEPCGWCNGRCIAGTPTYSYDGTCDGEAWHWRGVQCEGSGTQCPMHDQCQSCAAIVDDWCGWCANTRACVRGDRHGPLAPVEGCSPAAGSWIFNLEQQMCPP